MEAIKVSVVVPVYNVDEFLDNTLSDITGQTLREIEIICVDDGSKDNSREIVKEYQKKDERIQLVEQENKNAGAARNHGMQYAKGKYVVFWDSDDLFLENALETMYLQAEKTQADICICAARRYDNQTGKYFSSDAYLRLDYLPEKEVFQSLVETLLAQIELSFFRENLPAAITISGTSSEIGEKDRAQLKTALYALKAELALDMIFQETPTGFQLFTSAKYINYLTDHFQTSFLSVRLKEDYGFPVSVGYGIGKNITEARSHAEAALKESFYAKGSFVIDENGNLIGPLNRSHCVTIQKTMSEQLYRIAEQCKLSTLTIQKLNTILQITGTNKMTSQDLSEHLGVTLRNANRILNQLEKGGAATMVYSHSSTSKGRPVKVYELHFNSETL